MDDPRDELAYLASGVRSLLEQLVDSGAEEIPGDPEILRRFDQVNARANTNPPAHAPAPARAHAPAPAPAPSRAATPTLTRPTPPARIDAPVDESAKRLRLEQLQQVAASCTRCALHTGRTNSVFARGNPSAELMFVGEGPGADEDAQGLPFVGKAGQLLDKMIEAMGYQPDDVYIANIVKCRPPGNRKPEPSEMAACVGYLQEQIALVRPRAIVALGATACEGLLGVSGITRLRGTWRLYRGEIPVMPTFHPAYLLRTPEAKREVWADLQQVMQKLGKTPPKKR